MRTLSTTISDTTTAAFGRALMQLLMYAAVVTALPTAVAGVTDAGPQISISGTILGIIAIVTGFLFCFFGTSMWRFTIFCAGFYIFSTLAVSVMLNIEPTMGDGTFGPNRDWILLGVSFVVGIIGGFLAQCFYKLGVFLVGALGGLFLALWVLSLCGNVSGVIRIVVIIALMLVGAFLTIKFEKHVVIIGTAIAGAYILFFGIDCFANTGYRQSTEMILGGARNGQLVPFKSATDTPAGLAMLICMIIVAIIGAVVQYKRYTGFGRK